MRLVALLALVSLGCHRLDASGRERPSPLEGRWAIELQLDSASPLGPRPTARQVQGEVLISAERAPTIFAGDTSDPTQRFGRYRIDLRPFFGGPVAEDVSTSVIGPVDTLFTTELFAWLAAGGDSVQVEFIPRISHGGISLWGRRRGDRIRGQWEQRAYAGGAHGRFQMTRHSRTPAVVALPPMPPPPKPVDSTQLGRLRVRIFDQASQRYFVAHYEFRLPNGSWMSANMRTGRGPEGWGPVVWRPTGRMDVVVSRFRCGEKFWALADRLMQPVELRAGETTDVSFVVSIPELRISPTYDNREALPCTTGPGDEP